jgi:hypothetical protein
MYLSYLVVIWWQLLLQMVEAGNAAHIEVYPAASCTEEASSSARTFCSLHDAAHWISQHSSGPTDVCLHPGVHTLQRPMRLNVSHSGSRWTTCPSASASASAVISGGLSVSTATWQPEAGGIWAAYLPAGSEVQHMRTMWVDGVRANRTVLNASALLGNLHSTSSGYVSQHAVPWQFDAEEVELNYFQQLAPWQAQRCVLTSATGHNLTVVQPCFATVSQRAASVPGLPRNKSSGRTGCADSDPECGLKGNPLGSGLPMFVENLPLNDPSLPQESISPGQFSFSPRQQKIYYRPHSHDLINHDLSSVERANIFNAKVVVPISQGLFTAVGLRTASFSGISFEYMAWNSPSEAAGFVDFQDGVTSLGEIPGGLDCTNCTDVSVFGCTFSKLGGSGVTFSGIAQRINMSRLDVYDVSGNGITIGSHGNDSWPFQTVDNVVTDCVVSRVGQEYSGAVGVNAGYNTGLTLSHNTVTDVPYGALSVGAGAARAGYAHNNTISYNKIARFMLKMVDSAAIYVTGRQPGSHMYRNFILQQGLSGLEPSPHCDAPGMGRRCTVEEVIGFEDIWIQQVDPTGHKYNITRCERTADGWCNQFGNAHGGGIYTDNGSGGWHVTQNVLTDVYHWMFTWQPVKMVDMQFQHNWVDTPLFTNNAASSDPPVIVSDNTLITRGGTWPAAAQTVMADAGAHR